MHRKIKSVAVIGAGAAGLCAAKHALAAGYQVTVFEQSDQVGGTWNYTDQVQVDGQGTEVHSSMYQGLITNLPKEVLGYPDFPMPEQDRSYIPSAEVLSHFQRYAKEFQVNEVIRFRHQVIRVRPTDVGVGFGQWEIIVRDLSGQGAESEELHFDGVFVCTGHYHRPNWPNLKGYDSFRGRMLHSHDYRCPDPFKGETVLVIGCGPSGSDIATQISAVAERVAVSHHEKAALSVAENVSQKPDVQEIREDGAVQFLDGTFETFSVIVFCTGYKFAFPFLSVDCGLTVVENYVSPVYKHALNIAHPSMCFIGLPSKVCTSQLFDLQVRFCISMWTDAERMPTREEMLRDTEEEMRDRWTKGYNKRTAHRMGPEQKKYSRDIAELANVAPLRPAIMKLFDLSQKQSFEAFTTFRTNVFKIVDDENFIQIS